MRIGHCYCCCCYSYLHRTSHFYELRNVFVHIYVHRWPVFQFLPSFRLLLFLLLSQICRITVSMSTKYRPLTNNCSLWPFESVCSCNNHIHLRCTECVCVCTQTNVSMEYSEILHSHLITRVHFYFYLHLSK